MGLLRRLANHFRSQRLSVDLDDEIAFHIEKSIERRIGEGMSPEAARREVLLRFGNRTLTKERCREVNTLAPLEQVLQDVRYGLRMLRKNPSFTAICVLTLGLGLGINAALWTVVGSVLLRPLPFAKPERLMAVEETFLPSGWGPASPANLRDWREQNHSFAELVPCLSRSRNLQGSGEPERLSAVLAGSHLFATLGVQPLLGRTFPLDADRADTPPVAVLSEALWRRRFAGDAAMIGKPVKLDDEWFTVIGIMPAGFQFPVSQRTDVWLPLRLSPQEQENRGAHYLSVVGRLRPGVAAAAAQEDLQQVARRYVALKLEDEGRSVRVMPLREATVRWARPVLLTLTGAVAFVLLIACANVANLQLARTTNRKREVSVRAALGAGRGRLARQFLLENLVLSLIGGIGGLLLARLGVKMLTLFAASDLPRAGEIQIDFKLLAVLFLACLLTAIGFGSVPAFAAARVDPGDRLQEGAGRGILGASGHRRLRAVLVVAELTLALVLLIGAGLMMRTLWTLQSTDPGFVTGNVLTLHLAAPAKKYADRQVGQALFRPVLERIRELPGVSAGAVDVLPLQDWGVNGDFTIAGRAPARAGEKPFAEQRTVSPGYFDVLGIRLLAGRDLADSDDASAPLVTVVNKELVRRYFAGEYPLGQKIGWPEINLWFTIVGVVDDVREAQLSRPPSPQWYFSYLQTRNEWLPEMTLVVRSSGEPRRLSQPVTAAVHRVDPEQPVFNVKTMREVLDESISGSRLRLALLAIFAGLAVLLAAAGIYGVMSYLVAERTREFGMRAALGARPREILALVLGNALPQIALGVLLGLAGSWALTRLLRTWLFAVSPTDPVTFAGVTAALVMVALAAVYIPARRAAQVDPMTALRTD
ncbi:MAG TPA: ABC transporter permease [Thermoanaerobaculia bacterium]|jgi:predicted permease|nr:ABC transporter permease [Thermoanaerobaculia bacterium]